MITSDVRSLKCKKCARKRSKKLADDARKFGCGSNPITATPLVKDSKKIFSTNLEKLFYLLTLRGHRMREKSSEGHWQSLLAATRPTASWRQFSMAIYQSDQLVLSVTCATLLLPVPASLRECSKLFGHKFQENYSPSANGKKCSLKRIRQFKMKEKQKRKANRLLEGCESQFFLGSVASSQSSRSELLLLILMLILMMLLGLLEK